ncbi:MAG TPA: single-stranded-DNA-specific exonuclease RecJ [Gammaproteobacteria bacterium]|nr:single-stranded-DNA-specific exonuclease RecJ [Gammaproteobacteria bacterium]
MTTTIKRRPSVTIPGDLPTDLPPLLARLYAARGITDARELDRSLNSLLPFETLSGIADAVDLLQQALDHGQRILIVGDFDADGATSSALGVRALRAMGAAQVDYLVPNRFEYGYGLTPEIVAVAAVRKPDLLITVDNGIASIDGVAAAKALGMRVLVTDHHLPGDALPAADAIVNPNRPGDAFAAKGTAGVGVIFYVMLALRARLRETGWFTEQGIDVPNLAELLDLVALGTVADVVPLEHNNRILVAQGLARIRRGQCCPGISALIRVAKRNPQQLVAADLGFALGPRLNAAGRLEDMALGIECLLADDPDAALLLAQRLDELNRERRDIEAEMKAEAMVILDAMTIASRMAEDAELPVGLCLFEPHWHPGVIGILASRVKDRLHRPVIVFAESGEDEIKGSARSVPGLHIRDALDAVAKRHPDLLSKFGGHAMAAGLSLARADLDRFSQAFDEEVRRHLGAEDLRHEILSDGELSAAELNLPLAESLRAAGPWGQGFSEPLFDGVFDIVKRRIVGENHLKLVLRLPGSEQIIDAIAFNTLDDDWPTGTTQVELAYRLDVNEYNGRRSVQLMVEHIQVVSNEL